MRSSRFSANDCPVITALTRSLTFRCSRPYTAAIRDALNPDGEPVRGGRLRIGDKLMMTGRNLHDLGLMNGTLLRLVDEVTSSEGDDDALILAAEETVFRLPPEEADSLRLAYACSVHRGQ